METGVMRQNECIRGLAWKRLANTEIPGRGSNQHEMNIPRKNLATFHIRVVCTIQVQGSCVAQSSSRKDEHWYRSDIGEQGCLRDHMRMRWG